MEPISRRQFLGRFAGATAGIAAGVSGLLTGCGGLPPGNSQAQVPAHSLSDFQPLKAAAGAKNILFGAAVQQWAIQSDPDYAAQIDQHCSLILPENELKWDTVEPVPGVFNFGPGDALAAFAAGNGIQFRGHCLAWHQQLPSWAGNGSRSAVEDQLTSHITQTVRHYAGQMHSWDVVNEALNPGDGRSDCLRNTVWLKALGPSYIDLAFRKAAEADPKALLVYNDYGLEVDSSDGDRRRTGALSLLSSLRAGGTPVHALGIQAHLVGGNLRLNAGKLTEFIREVGALGLKVLITELDVSDQSFPADISSRDGMVADSYQQFLNIVLQEPAVSTVITWGLTDRYTWLSSYSPRSDGQPVRPLPLDSALKPKLALYAMLDSFRAANGR